MNLLVQREEQHRRRQADDHDRREQVAPIGGIRRLEGIDAKLHRGALGAGEEIHGVDEVVVDHDGAEDDDRSRDRLHQREDDVEEQAQRAAAVHDGRFVDLLREGRGVALIEHRGEREQQRDLDQHEAGDGVGHMQLRQDPVGRNDGERRGEAGENDLVGGRRQPAAASLQHERRHRRDQDQNEHGADGDDAAVEEGAQEHMVIVVPDVGQVFPQRPLRREYQRQLGSLRAGFAGVDEDEVEHDPVREHCDDQRQNLCRDAERRSFFHHQRFTSFLEM